MSAYTATKANAAAGGAGLGGAIAYLISPLLWEEPSVEQIAALTTVVSVVVAWGSAYLAPMNRLKGP